MRVRTLFRAVVALGAIVTPLLMVTLSADDNLSVEERETIERTFPAPKNIDIDNVDGSITLTGTDAREVKVEIHKTIHARSAEKVQKAKHEVRLDMAQQGDELRLYVDGPFRCKCTDGSFNYRGSHHYGYEVSFDFTVKAPRDTNVRLRTVNHGNIRLEIRRARSMSKTSMAAWIWWSGRLGPRVCAEPPAQSDV
jgi:hypothetical protein